MTGSAMRTAFILFASIVAFTGVASAQPLSRADAVAQALAANPTVKLSRRASRPSRGPHRRSQGRRAARHHLEHGCDAVARSGALEQPELRRVSAGVSRCAERPFRRTRFSTSADFRQTLFSFKLGKALEAARVARSAGEQDMQRARQLTALDAIRAYNQLLFAIEQLRVIRDERAVEADSRRLRAQPARGGCGHRARSASRRGRPRERARRSDARRERSRRRARDC